MSNSSKVMVDVKGGNNMMYLPLDKLTRPSASAARLDNLTPEALRELSNRMSDFQGRNTQPRSTARREVR